MNKQSFCVWVVFCAVEFFFFFSVLYHLEKQMYPVFYLNFLEPDGIYMGLLIRAIITISRISSLYVICNNNMRNIFERRYKTQEKNFYSCLVDGMCACIFCSYIQYFNWSLRAHYRLIRRLWERSMHVYEI